MRRREFITLVGGAAAAWPVLARAQQSEPVIGILNSGTSAGNSNNVAAFRQGLKEAGFVEGQNVAIELRWAENQYDRLAGLAADLANRRVAVIVGNTLAALRAKATTTAIPIVFTTGSDPVRDGLVPSLNRPGGNVTGVVFLSGALGGKRLELLRQLVPQATTVAMLMHPSIVETEVERNEVQDAAQAMGKQLIVFEVGSSRDIEAAFAALVARGAGALLVGTGTFMFNNREQIIALAARHAIPAMYAQRESVVAGGLMSYGTSLSDAYRQAAIYAARILKGEKPADLPVIQSTKFEFVINPKTAQMLGLTISPDVLSIADDVIE